MTFTFFITTLLITTLIASSLPEATATPTLITIESIEPSSGYVGDAVQVIGEIDTVNGSYIIFFDEETVKDGTATGTAVNDTFIVPPRPMGDYTVTLHDVTTKSNSTSSELFAVQTAYFINAVVPSPPEQLQEGESTKISVSITGGNRDAGYVANITVVTPHGAVYYNDTLQLTNTTNTGYGEGNTRYPADFSVGAHTNYTGIYHIAFNETLATANFTVGLTHKSEYVRRYLSGGKEKTSQVVIQGSGYDNETVTINITYYNDASFIPVEGYPKSENASDGIVIHRWTIPDNATLGTYNVTLTSANIDKPVKDTQNFTVIEIIVSCQTQNRYDNQSLAGVSVKAYRGALGSFYIDNRTTNGTGWVDFLLDRGHYSFGAYWREVEVGSLLFRNSTGDATDYVLRFEFYIKCELARIVMVVSDKDGPLPFIDVALANVTLAPKKSPLFQTNYTGIISTNAFTDTIYRIEARRNGHLFLNQSIGNLTKTIGNLTEPFQIPCPTYTLFINALDSKERPIRNATVRVIEWSSGRIVGEGKTNQFGSVRLDSTFGRYKVRVYNVEETVILNETIVDVIRNQFYLALHCRTVNLDLSVKAIDYLGQPIPNAMVKIEREGMEILNLTTDPDGVASKHGILGGDYRAYAYRISLYVAGRLYEVKSLDLDESGEIVFRVGDYVMVGGYPLEFNQLITGISLTIVVVVFCASTLIYRRRSKKS